MSKTKNKNSVSVVYYKSKKVVNGLSMVIYQIEMKKKEEI